MSHETHKHYHINLLPQCSEAWFFIMFAIIGASAFWAMARESANKTEVEKAKYEAQVHSTK